jgi:hypothetical protein
MNIYHPIYIQGKGKIHGLYKTTLHKVNSTHRIGYFAIYTFTEYSNIEMPFELCIIPEVYS